MGYFGFSARCQRYPTTATVAAIITNVVGPFRWNHEPTEYAKIPIPFANRRAISGLPEKPRGFGSLVSNMRFLAWSAVKSENFIAGFPDQVQCQYLTCPVTALIRILPKRHDIFGPAMEDQRVEKLVQAFRSSRGQKSARPGWLQIQWATTAQAAHPARRGGGGCR